MEKGMPSPARHFCLHPTDELCQLDTLCCKGLNSEVLNREGEERNDWGMSSHLRAPVD